jgi:hypothetical protein
MRSMILLALASCLGLAAPAGVEGTWRATFLGDPGHWPKTVGEMTFEFHVAGKDLTGTAHIGSWPGEAAIQDGKVDGDRITFTVIGKGAWWSNSREGRASGYPRLTLTGSVADGEMRLHVVWDSVMIYGEAGKASEYDLAGKRE